MKFIGLCANSAYSNDFYRIEDSTTSAERRPALCVLFQFRAGFSVSALQQVINYRYQVHLSSSEISMFQSSLDMVCVLFDFYSSFCSGSAWNCFPFRNKICAMDQSEVRSFQILYLLEFIYLIRVNKVHFPQPWKSHSMQVGQQYFWFFLSKALHTFHSCSNHLEEKTLCS